MGIDADAVLDKLVSHALTSGYFDRVNAHEPKAAPGNGLTCAFWVQRIRPVLSSGLDKTSVCLEFRGRIYTSMLSEPQDAIDPGMIDAASALMQAYTGDFTFGASIRQVDLLGEFGVPLSAEAGFLTQDNKPFRVMDLTIPLVIDDIWEQTA